MSSAITSMENIGIWLFATLVSLPPALVAMRLIWRGRSVDERSMALAAALVTAPFITAAILWLSSWYLGFTLGFTLTGGHVRVACVLLALGSLPFLKESLPPLSKFLIVCGSYCAVFAAWAVFRAYNPEIFWGEKPMDFSFLNYLIRAEVLPPDDPWAAGHSLNYYYFGHFVWAIQHKLSGIDARFGYNLSLCSIGTSLVLATWCLLKTLNVNGKLAVFGAALIALGSNLEWIRLLVLGHPKVGFDFFWATSRLLTSPAITEYPSWSVMFGDLHAHLSAMPLGIACYSALLRLTRSEQSATPSLASTGFYVIGFLEAVLYATNAWEVIPQMGILLLLLFAVTCSSNSVRSYLEIFKAILCICLGALLMGVPWLASLGEPVTLHYGWVVQDFSTAGQQMRHFGQFIVPIMLASLAGFINWPSFRNYWIWMMGLSAGLVPVCAGVYVAQFSLVTPPFLFLFGCGVALCVGMFKVLLRGERRDASVGILLIAAGALLALSELIFVMDHTNTMFKMYLSIWVWLGALAIVAVSRLGLLQGIQSPIRQIRCRSLSILSIGLMCIGLCGSLVNVYGLMTFQRIDGPRPTLDGMAYLSTTSKDEAALIEWIRTNIRGVPVTVEAIGDSYREFGRISMNTGLPAVLGWAYHVSQRGVLEGDLEDRATAVHTIYASQNLKNVKSALKKYGVDYVVVGQVERKLATEGRYSEDALQKFADHPELFKRVFSSGDVALYAVRLD